MRVKKQNGFTMIELLISVALTAILFAGIMVGIQFGMRSVTINRHRTEAIVLAQHDIEKIKSDGYEFIVVQPYTTNGVLGATKVESQDITEDTKVIGKEVKVSVRWSDFGRNYTEAVASFIRDPAY